MFPILLQLIYFCLCVVALFLVPMWLCVLWFLSFSNQICSLRAVFGFREFA